jgi:GH25 family lysozyme M1 (1,4-beta-N-acetylmuramidase)
MSNTLKRNAVMLLAVVMLMAVAMVPTSLADSDTADSGLAAAVEKTQATVTAKLTEIKSAVSENVGIDVSTLETLWNYGDNVEAGVESSTDDFVAMLEGIGQAYDKGDVEGILSTPKTFVDGLQTYLGGIKGAVKP